MSSDALVISKLGELAQALGFYFINHRASGFGFVEKIMESVVVAQSGGDPNSVEGAFCFECGQKSMTTVDHVIGFALSIFRFGRCCTKSF